jgi:L-rhamnose mutarotase
MISACKLTAAAACLAVLAAAGCDGGAPPEEHWWEQPGAQGGLPYDPSSAAGEAAPPAQIICTMCLINTDVGVSQDFEEQLTLPELELRLPEEVLKYRRLHRDMPAEVREAMAAHNVRNYSVFVGYVEPDYYAVRYFEYVGTSYVVDMRALDRDGAYRAWRRECEAYEVALIAPSASPWEAVMDQIFHAELTPGSLRASETASPDEEGAALPAVP